MQCKYTVVHFLHLCRVAKIFNFLCLNLKFRVFTSVVAPTTDASMLSCKFDTNLCGWYTKSVEDGPTFELLIPRSNTSLGPAVDFNTGSNQGKPKVFILKIATYIIYSRYYIIIVSNLRITIHTIMSR